jgi:hypothetical protein
VVWQKPLQIAEAPHMIHVTTSGVGGDDDETVFFSGSLIKSASGVARPARDTHMISLVAANNHK